MPSALTQQQQIILRFIEAFIAQHGWPPTRGEIAAGLGLRNRQGIDQHLRALETKKAIALTPKISRGIRILRAATADDAVSATPNQRSTDADVASSAIDSPAPPADSKG